MLYLDLINESIKRLKKDINDGAIRDRIKTLVNSQYEFVANAYHWRNLLKYQEIAVLPFYDTGTITVTKDSYTVNISGGSLSSNMAGRFLEFDGSAKEYRIKYVSGNDLVLYSPIAEKSANGKTYKIKKVFYSLLPNTRLIFSFGGESDYNKNYVQRSLIGNGNGGSRSFPYTEYGDDEFSTDYTTGTITIDKNTNVLTGSGTSFLGNVFEGSEIQVEDNKFYVKRVESDTRIILLNNPVENISIAKFTARNENVPQTQILFTAGNSSSDPIIIPIKYISKVYPMVNENYDRTELDSDFRESILSFVEARYQLDLNDPKATSNLLLNKAQIYLEKLKSNKRLVVSPFRQFAPSMPKFSGR